MLPKEEKEKIIGLAKQYNASRVLLFGSALRNYEAANDLDLAIEGVAPSDFFRIYADLIAALPKRIDLIDLSKKSRFNDLIQHNAIVLYE